MKIEKDVSNLTLLQLNALCLQGWEIEFRGGKAYLQLAEITWGQNDEED